MSTSSLPLPAPTSAHAPRTRTFAIARPQPELIGLLLLAAVLYLWGLGQNGYANEYYSAAVRSMAGSWHAFLYGSFDSGGLMTVDKPPLALWIQALSVRAFGFSSWSMLVPQALMGIASVGLIYDLTRRRFGRAAGFAGGLALALTPVTVAISRHNNPDALLVLCSVAALWLTVRGLEDGRARWMAWAGLAIGLGFETKMAAALLIVPGIAAAWLWASPRGGWAAVRALLAGGATLLVSGLAWPLLMWLTPASSRPWVSGTEDNSIWSLIFGYNGLGRLFGQSGGPGGGAGGGAGVGAGGPGGGGLFGGEPGTLRLLNQALGGQGGWFLGIALVGGAAVLVQTRLRRTDARTGWLIAIGGAFLVTAIAFSKASGIFHPYYVSLLAPFTAALVGATVGVVLKDGLTARIVAPLAIFAGIICELTILGNGAGGAAWTKPLMLLLGIGGATALAFGLPAKARAIVVAVAFGALLLAPASWAFQTLGHATSGTFPMGGAASVSMGMGGPGGGGGMGGPGGGTGGPGGPPSGGTPPAGGFTPPGATAGAGAQPTGTPAAGGMGMGGGGGFGGGNSQSLTSALAYAKAHGGGTIGVSSQMGASAAIIRSGADVAGMGGFSGRESEVSVAWLANAVADGRIRWVLGGSDSGGVPQDGRTGSTTVMSAAAQACTAVSLDSTAASTAATTTTTTTTTAATTLYDCAGKADALRSAGT